MKFENEFVVNATADSAWTLLTDIRAIAPCLPGTRLTGTDGEDYLGETRVKVGPLVAAYTGRARFLEKDDVNHRAVIEASGRAAPGRSSASATVVAQLRGRGEATLVQVTTNLRTSGKLAQLGDGILREVSERLSERFSQRLEKKLTAPDTPEGVVDSVPDGTDTGPGTEPGGPAVLPGPTEHSRSDEDTEGAVSAHGGDPLDLVRESRGAVTRQMWPILAVLTVVCGLLLGHALFG